METRRWKLWGWVAIVLSAVLLGVIVGVRLWAEILINYLPAYSYVVFALAMVNLTGYWFVQMVVFLGLYFLPSLIVSVRQVRSMPISRARDFLIRLVVGVWREGSTPPSCRTVFRVNLFLGWTVIGWFIALLMAFAREEAHSNQDR